MTKHNDVLCFRKVAIRIVDRIDQIEIDNKDFEFERFDYETFVCQLRKITIRDVD